MSDKRFSFIPLADRLLIEPAEPEAVTPGGIVIPDNAKEKQQKGFVRAVGKGRLLDNGDMNVPECKVGDQVLFKRYAGNEVELGDALFLIVEEKDVLGILNTAD